jgi:hypothetical protein
VQPSVIKKVQEGQADARSDGSSFSIPGALDKLRMRENKDKFDASLKPRVESSSLHVRFYKTATR